VQLNTIVQVQQLSVWADGIADQNLTDLQIKFRSIDLKEGWIHYLSCFFVFIIEISRAFTIRKTIPR